MSIVMFEKTKKASCTSGFQIIFISKKGNRESWPAPLDFPQLHRTEKKSMS